MKFEYQAYKLPLDEAFDIALNTLGDKEWELVSCTIIPNRHLEVRPEFFCVFKRYAEVEIVEQLPVPGVFSRGIVLTEPPYKYGYDS